MASIYEQIKTAQVNSFTGGINTDLHPMVQPSDTMTDCVNGTLITYQGNENIVQNDMGNYELKNAKLPEGYIPLGMKEHNGIIYIVSTNPITGKTQIGSYPSPQTLIEDGDPIERSINEIEIPTLELNDKTDLLSDDTLTTNGYTALTNKAESIIFSDLFDDLTKITNNDKYILVNDPNDDMEADNSAFQYGQYFILDSDNKITNIDPLKTKSNFNGESNEINTNVHWDIPGWLGYKYKLYTPQKHIQNVSGSILKTINLTNYSIIDNQFVIDGNNEYKVGIKTDNEYTFDFAEVCKLVKSNEVWFTLKGKMPDKYNYSVVSHEFSNGIGLIEFADRLVVQPDLFRSYVDTIDFPEGFKNINLDSKYLNNVNTIIINPTVESININFNQDLNIIIRGNITNQINISYSETSVNTWDPATKINISCNNKENAKQYISADKIQSSITYSDLPEIYQSTRLTNYIEYTSSNEAKICNGIINDPNFYKLTFNFDPTDVLNTFLWPNFNWSIVDTVIFPETVTTGFDSLFLNADSLNLYYSSKYSLKYPDRTDENNSIRYYDYYTHCHYVSITDPEVFDGFINYNIAITYPLGSDDAVGRPPKILSDVRSMNASECYIHINYDLTKCANVKFNFKQYYIEDNVLYSIINIPDDETYQLCATLGKYENGIIPSQKKSQVKPTENVFTISNVFYKCPKIKNLKFGIFYRSTASDGEPIPLKRIDDIEYSDNITIKTIIDSSELNGVNANTKSILIESVPYYVHDGKVLILDHLKNDVTIDLLEPSDSDISIRRFQYAINQVEGNKEISVTLEFNKLIDGSLYKSNLYRFVQGKLVGDVVQKDVDLSGVSSTWTLSFTIQNHATNIPFFIFEFGDLYRGIIVNSEEVNNKSEEYNDYNLIPNILQIISSNGSTIIDNYRNVYMYVPMEAIDNGKIQSDKCHLIDYYDGPFILNKTQMTHDGYIGVGIIADITINNELLFGSTTTVAVPYNIHSNNRQQLVSNNKFTVLCQYKIGGWNPSSSSADKVGFNKYATREYLVRSTYPPFTLMKENIDNEDYLGLNYKLTPEIIQYAEWTSSDRHQATKIINVEKQSGGNLGTHIEAVTAIESLEDNIKGDIYSTDFSNLTSQLKKNQLFYLFNCSVKTKDNGLVIPFPIMYSSSSSGRYWRGEHIYKQYNISKDNDVFALTATRQSEWLPSSSFMHKFKDRGMKGWQRVLATTGASIVLGMSLRAITIISTIGAVVVAAAIVGFIILLSKLKLKDRYFVFIGMRYNNKNNSNNDNAPFIIPMWGCRRSMRSYMITESDTLERAEQRMITFCKNVYYLNTKSLSIADNDTSAIYLKKDMLSNNISEQKIQESEITVKSRGTINTKYEGVYTSQLPELLTNLIGHTNNNYASIQSNSNGIKIKNKFNITDDLANTLTNNFTKMCDCVNSQISTYFENKGQESNNIYQINNGFILDLQPFKDTNGNISNDNKIIIDGINSSIKHLAVDNKGNWYYQYNHHDEVKKVCDGNSFQGNRGREWWTLFTKIWITDDKIKFHAGEAVTPEDGFAPIARPCEPKDPIPYTDNPDLEYADSFMVPYQSNQSGHDEKDPTITLFDHNTGNPFNEWEIWKNASLLDPPEYLKFLATTYVTKKL